MDRSCKIAKNDIIKLIMDIDRDCDNIDMDSVCRAISMQQRRKQILADHTHKIWQGTNSYWCTYLPDASKPKRRRLIRKSTRKALYDAIIDYWTVKSGKSQKLYDVFNEWNEHRAKIGQISLSTRGRMIQDANRYYGGICDRYVDTFSEIELITFIEEKVSELKLTPKALTNLKTLFRGTFNYAKRKGMTDIDIDSVIRLLDIPSRMLKHNIKEDCEEVFNDVEFKKLVKYLGNHLDTRNKALLLILITGIRPGEAVALMHCDIITDYGIKIQRTEIRYKATNGTGYAYTVSDTPKTLNGIRTIPVPDNYIWLLRQLDDTNRGQDYIFTEKGKRINTQMLRRRLYSICNQLDIVKKSPNKARKTYATILLDNGVDQNLVKRVMGHASIMTTEINYHRNRKSEQEISATISALPDFRLGDNA